jgi:hypothetical protein
MKRSVLVAVISILAGVGGFFFRQRQLDAQAAALNALRQSSLVQAEKDLGANKFKAARDTAWQLRKADALFEPERVGRVLEVSDKEVQALALLEAGEKAIERDQLLAARVAWETVPEGTSQKASKDQLAAHIDGLVEQRYVRARKAATGNFDAIKAALFGLREVLAMKPRDETALKLQDALDEQSAKLGGAKSDAGFEIPEHRKRHVERLLAAPPPRRHPMAIQIIRGSAESGPDAGAPKQK